MYLSRASTQACVLLFCAAAPGCSSKGSGDTSASTQGEATSSTTDTSTEGESNGSETDSSESGQSGEAGESGDGDGDSDSYCVDQGFEALAMHMGSGGAALGDFATDFTVNTTFGDFSLAQRWTGCDTYVVVRDLQDNTANSLLLSANDLIWQNSARNVHWIFVNDASDPAARAVDWQNQIGASIGSLDDQDLVDWWADRVHFVTDAPADIGGGLGDFLEANPDVRGFGIDRAQQWDHLGSHSTVTSTFVPALYVFADVTRWYNFRHAQDLMLADKTGISEVAIIDQQTFEPDCVVGEACFDTQNGPFSNSNNNRVWTGSFPDEAAMAEFDTMEIVIEATCGPDNYSDCGHWDYEALLDLCDDADCTNVLGEAARWITPYARPGRRTWVIDASHVLGMIGAGGDQHFRFSMVWNMNPSTWDIRARLSNSGTEGPTQTELVWRENAGFDASYNARFAPFDFTPPDGTTKVELVSIVSGHGQDTGNCAEWCDHHHDFTVNSASYTRQFPGQVGGRNCASRVDEGVIPGQFGNWEPGRAGWCPGLPVQPWRVDITDDVTIGESNTLSYVGSIGGAEPSAHGRIRMNTFLVYSQ